MSLKKRKLFLFPTGKFVFSELSPRKQTVLTLCEIIPKMPEQQFIPLENLRPRQQARREIPEERVEPISFERAVALGMYAGDSYGGLQVDLNVVFQKLQPGQEELVEAHACDHNCRLKSEENPDGGGYECPAANTLPENKHLDMRSITPAEIVLRGITTATEGLQSTFPDYLERISGMGYPLHIVDGLTRNGNKLPEVNLFGGNPEMHPEIHEIITQLTKAGYPVTLTTTGKKLLLSPEFIKRLLRNPPTRIALSADDLPTDINEIKRLASLSQAQLRAEYRKISHHAGQEQKAYEAMGALQLAKENPRFPQVMLNFVLHPGNIDHAEAMLQTLGELFPGVLFNPYPAQSAFSGDLPIFSPNQLPTLEHVIDLVIEKHTQQPESSVDFRVVPRLYYYLLLKSVFLGFRNDPQKISAVLSGYGLWRCYQDPVLTNRYLQIGGAGSSSRYAISGESPLFPGGHPGCFWTPESVVDPNVQVWTTDAPTVRRYITSGIQEQVNHSKHPCDGCGFPRLVCDETSARAGIPRTREFDNVRQSFIELRRNYVGY